MKLIRLILKHTRWIPAYLQGAVLAALASGIRVYGPTPFLIFTTVFCACGFVIIVIGAYEQGRYEGP
jgi:hypothetical protein